MILSNRSVCETQNYRNPQIVQNQCFISHYLERVGVSNFLKIKNSINDHYTQFFLKKLKMSNKTVCGVRDGMIVSSRPMYGLLFCQIVALPQS